MTEILNKEFSRKTFVKGGGALSSASASSGAFDGEGAGGDRALRRATRRTTRTRSTRASTINADNTATLSTSQVELGQGTPTGF